MKIFVKRTNYKIENVLVLGGVVTEWELLKAKDISIYAADGGLNNLLLRDIIPRYVIGDMDSVTEEDLLKAKSKGVNIIKIPDQDSNDFEKAINYLLQIGVGNVTVVGFGGNDIEHTINNLSILSKYSNRIEMTVLNGRRELFLASSGKTYSIETKLDEKISILPLQESILDSKGLKWELNSHSLAMGKAEGMGNIAMKSNVEITVETGEIAIVIDSQMPYRLGFAKT
ncbi:MAG: thiamine diphosphokinase [Candidatus Kapaibacteriales bacterium]